MTHYIAEKQQGHWKGGIFVVTESVRCPHHHRDEEAAVRCLSSNAADTRSPRGLGWRGWGLVRKVDGAEETVTREIRPERYREERHIVGIVTVVWRHWDYDDRAGETDLLFTAGDWTVRHTVTTKHSPLAHGPAFAIGMANGYNATLGVTDPERLAEVWRRARAVPAKNIPPLTTLLFGRGFVGAAGPAQGDES